MHRIARYTLGTLAAGALIGAGSVAYAAGYEVRAYRLRRFDVPVLAPGSRPLRVLHVSDLHLMPDQGRKAQWIAGLAALEPDFVVNTGDNISNADSVPRVAEALGPLLDLPGAFVFGSNDYFAPSPRNPLRYFYDRGTPTLRAARGLPTDHVRKLFADAGWLDLNNARGELEVDGRRIAFAGVDDPHIRYDDLAAVAGPADPSADLAIAVAHAPYRRILDAFEADGYPLILAGHTHGGQVCVPGYGALVSNCDLPPRQARGVSRWGRSWLHVSAGLGTSPFAPYRFACHPEASLLTLRAPGAVGAVGV